MLCGKFGRGSRLLWNFQLVWAGHGREAPTEQHLWSVRVGRGLTGVGPEEKFGNGGHRNRHFGLAGSTVIASWHPCCSFAFVFFSLCMIL